MWTVEIDNIAGIRSGTTTVDRGLNVVQASNFRGKSSFIAAMRTVTGVTGHYDAHPLTEGAESGSVTIEMEAETYEVILDRSDATTVTRTGTPYLDDRTDQMCARLFAFLDEDNPIRRAVRNDDDLTDLLQAPLDIENVDRQIESLRRQKAELETEIAEAERAAEQAPAVQEEVTQLEEKLAGLRERREQLAETDETGHGADTLSEDLAERKRDLERIEGNIQQLENRVQRKTETLETKREQLAELEVPSAELDSGDVEAKREEIDQLDVQLGLIEDVRRANRNLLDEDRLDLVTDVERSIAADEVECWVCGEHTSKDAIERRLDAFQTQQRQLREQKQTLEAEIEEYEQRRREVESQRRKQESLEREIGRLENEIDELRADLRATRERKEQVAAEIDDVRSRLDAVETEHNEELTDVKAEIRTVELTLEEKRETLAELEATREQLASLSEQRDDLREEITELRNHKKRTQERLTEEFNAALSAVIDRFEVGFSGARLLLKTGAQGDVDEVELTIAREIDGNGRETSVNTLSEGEVELIGVVVALAGYRAFDVGNSVPFMLIDGISQLAAEHLRTLTTHLEETSETIVTTAYPEAGEFEGEIITPEEWDVVSDEQRPPLDH